MSFDVYTPASPLNRFVRYLYSPKGPMPYSEEKVLPSPQTDMKINFGGRFRAKHPGASTSFAIDPNGWCMGVWDQYHTVIWPQDPDFIGVSFRPGGAYALLGVDVSVLHNQLIPMESLWGASFGQLRERLYASPTPQARFVLLEQLLTARLHHHAHMEKIAPALFALQAGHGLIEIGGLQQSANVTQKHLITMFNRVAGASPKRMARLYRLQSLIDSIEHTRPVSWTTVAQDFMFSDQAHFNKEFKHFTGNTPGEYLAQRKSVLSRTPEHAVHKRLLPTG